MARLPTKGDLQRIDQYLGDISTKMDAIASAHKDWAKEGTATLHSHIDIASQMERISQKMQRIEKLGKQAGQYTDAQAKALNDLREKYEGLEAAAEKLDGAWKAVGKTIAGNVANAFDKLGKSIISLGLDAFEFGIHKLYEGIQKVYELHERWAKLMGEFRNRLGVTTKGMDNLSKAAANVEGKIYGLTGAFGQGAPMVNDFLEGLQRVEDVTTEGVKSEKERGRLFEKFITQNVMAARVLGVSAGEMGQLNHALQQLGEGLDDTNDLTKEMVAGAKAAGVSTAAFSKEIIESKDWLTSFGKAGQKMFVQMATYAKKLGVSLKSLEGFTKMTDTFDSTAQSVAKINTVFGTTISSLQLMLEQDPSKRLETVRQALLDQGKTFDQLSRQEVDFLSETMHVSREELAGVLKTGKSLEDVQKDQEKARAEHEGAQKNLDKLINRTATTLFSFGQAWDKVTKAIEKLIAPFTQALGLTAQFDKNGKRINATFGQTMSAVFERLVKFIEEVAKNPDWQKFMRTLADDAKALAKHISDIATGPKLGEWIKSVTTGATDFYNMMKKAFAFIEEAGKKLMPVFEFIMNHLDGIMKSWLVFKGAMAGFKIAGGIKDVVGLLRGAGGEEGGGGGLLGMLGKAGKSFGGVLGSAVKGGTIGEAAAAGGGGAAGAVGVAGAVAAAGLAGFALGKYLDDTFGISDWIAGIHKFEFKENDETRKSRLEAEAAEAKLTASIKKRQEEEEGFSKKLSQIGRDQEIRDQRTAVQDSVLNDLHEQMEKTGKKSIRLDKDQVMVMGDRIDELMNMGLANKDVIKAFTELTGTGTISKKSLEAINKASDTYEKTIKNLNEQAQIQADQSKKFEEYKFAAQQDKLKKDLDAADKDLAAKKEAAERLKKFTFVVDWSEDALNNLVKTGELEQSQKDAAMKGDLSRDKVSEIVQQKRANKAELAYRDAQSKRAQAAQALEDLEKQHQDKIHKIQLKAAIEMSAEFREFKATLTEGTDMETAFNEYVKNVGGKAKSVEGFQAGDIQQMFKRADAQQQGQAAGGIVTSPKRLLVGEAGPEAIIPLKAMASSRESRNPAKYGGEAASKLVNFAAGRNTQNNQQTTKIVAGDVYLDGRLVGRHVARQLLVQESGG